MELEVTMPCIMETPHCHNCYSHFMEHRPNVRRAVITKHFLHDLGDEKARFAVQEILDCSHESFSELHKFEENVNGYHLFRAKQNHFHMVYSMAGNLIIFLRAFDNFKEYRRFLHDRREIERSITSEISG
jgi:hypothetical protein